MVVTTGVVVFVDVVVVANDVVVLQLRSPRASS